MVSFSPPKNQIVKMDKGVQIVKNQYLVSKSKSFTLYTSVMTQQSAELTLKSYKSAFPMYKHEIKFLAE